MFVFRKHVLSTPYLGEFATHRNMLSLFIICVDSTQETPVNLVYSLLSMFYFLNLPVCSGCFCAGEYARRPERSTNQPTASLDFERYYRRLLITSCFCLLYCVCRNVLTYVFMLKRWPTGEFRTSKKCFNKLLSMTGCFLCRVCSVFR